MAKAKDMVGDAVDTARPYVERLARDDELHEHVKRAYDSARKIYDDLLGDRGTTGMALKVARDKDLQSELKRAVEELRKAGERAQGAGYSAMVITVDQQASYYERSQHDRNLGARAGGPHFGLVLRAGPGGIGRGALARRRLRAERRGLLPDLADGAGRAAGRGRRAPPR